MYYHYSNIDPDTCNANLNFEGDSTQFWTPYGIIGINVKNINPESDTFVYCEFNWWNEYYFELDSISQTYGILCYDFTIIQNNYIDILKNDPNYIVLSNPYSNNISCNNNDCIMYISQSLNSWEEAAHNIYCPDNICNVVWFVLFIVYQCPLIYIF